MNGKTHKLGGICTGIVASAVIMYPPYTSDKLLLAGVLVVGSSIGGLMPDIDHTGSTMGYKHKISSNIINKLFGHRGATHSPLVHLLIFALLLSLAGFITSYPRYIYLSFITGLFLGGISHLVLDIITVSGIPLLYPISKKKYRILKLTAGKSEKGKRSNTEKIVDVAILVITGVLLKFFLL